MGFLLPPPCPIWFGGGQRISKKHACSIIIVASERLVRSFLQLVGSHGSNGVLFFSCTAWFCGGEQGLSKKHVHSIIIVAFAGDLVVVLSCKVVFLG
jgi:hypothetical protein